MKRCSGFIHHEGNLALSSLQSWCGQLMITEIALIHQASVSFPNKKCTKCTQVLGSCHKMTLKALSFDYQQSMYILIFYAVQIWAFEGFLTDKIGNHLEITVQKLPF